jgi:hypothetical protein
MLIKDIEKIRKKTLRERIYEEILRLIVHSEALKLASLLRCTADERGLIFATRGRPRK